VNDPRGRRVLVAGGAGFVGSNLIERLLDDGCHVICLDNFYTGTRTNVVGVVDHPRFELVEHDVVEPYDADVDEIYNLACPASPPHYQRDPVYTMKTSWLGALNLLDLAVRRGARILQASTSEVYGDPAVHPQPESYWGNVNTIGIRSCYDEGKRAAETLFFDYHRTRGADIKVVRIFNTYGPRMDPDDGRVVSNFIVQALRGEDLTVYGDGSQTRSFCFVDDLVDGLVAMMASPASVTGPVNLGNPGEFTMLELADKVLARVGGPSRIVHRPLPADDPKLRRPDISAARELLGWQPTITLDEGLDRAIPYFRSRINP
jgi:UDP-glucuronate decarboxylase